MSGRTFRLFLTLIGAACGYVVIKRFLSPDSLNLRDALIQGFLVGFGLAVVTIAMLARIKSTRITAFGCGLPSNGMFIRAACRKRQRTRGRASIARAAVDVYIQNTAP